MAEHDSGTFNVSEPFEDPALKTAVKQAWGQECCSEQLRRRCTCLCSGGSSRWRIGWPIAWGLTAAALVALAAGVPLISRSRSKSSSLAVIAVPPAASPIFPVALQTALVNTHEHCVHLANHHRLDSKGSDNDVTIAEAMRARLLHAVLVARPADPGWVFHGAAICHAGATPCGHLVFSRGNLAISIFSLPSASAPALRDGAEISAVADGHPLVAFARDGAVFCLVGSGPAGSISVDDLNQMRQRMEPDVTADRPERSTELAELLTPVGP